MQKKNKADYKPTNIFIYLYYLQLSKVASSKSIKSLKEQSNIVVPELGGFEVVGFLNKKAEEECAEVNKKLLINNWVLSINNEWKLKVGCICVMQMGCFSHFY